MSRVGEQGIYKYGKQKQENKKVEDEIGKEIAQR